MLGKTGQEDGNAKDLLHSCASEKAACLFGGVIETKMAVCKLGGHPSTLRADYEAFLAAFEKLPDQVTEFEFGAGYSLADHIVVYGRKDIRVTFKNGQEIFA
jgi:hypothetical protein